MGTRTVICLLIVYVHLVTSKHTAALPPPPPPQLPYSSVNSCPDHLISQIIDALDCTPPTVSPPPPAPPPHGGGDLNPVADAMSDRELNTATFAGVAVRAIAASRGEEGKILMEVLLILIFPVAVRAISFPEIPMRNFFPIFAQEMVIGILFVNAITAVLLPAEWMLVPAVCCLSSLLILAVAPRLR